MPGLRDRYYARINKMFGLPEERAKSLEFKTPDGQVVKLLARTFFPNRYQGVVAFCERAGAKEIPRLKIVFPSVLFEAEFEGNRIKLDRTPANFFLLNLNRFVSKKGNLNMERMIRFAEALGGRVIV